MPSSTLTTSTAAATSTPVPESTPAPKHSFAYSSNLSTGEKAAYVISYILLILLCSTVLFVAVYGTIQYRRQPRGPQRAASSHPDGAREPKEDVEERGDTFDDGQQQHLNLPEIQPVR